jgi:histone deacetylase HOS3
MLPFPGNGTQAIAWAINAETERRRLELEAQAASGPFDSQQTPSHLPNPYPPPGGTDLLAKPGTPVLKPAPTSTKPGLRLFYASAHDILSYPCEGGDPELVRDASVSLPHGAHGQWIENVHLETYESEREFWIGRDAEDEGVYERTFRRLLKAAEGFVQRTHSTITPICEKAQAVEDEDDVIIFVSCGFDASEHEYPSMSRHGRHVPASFYYRFAKDVRALADKHARGRVVSVLEGGYSDRALIAGGLAWLTGLVGYEPHLGEDKLTEHEEAVSVSRTAGKIDDAAPSEVWIDRTGPRDWWALGNVDKVSAY